MIKELRHHRIDFILQHQEHMSRREMAKHLNCTVQVVYKLMTKVTGVVNG